MTIRLSGQACGATVSGDDFSKDLGGYLVANIRTAWIEHGVLAFLDPLWVKTFEAARNSLLHPLLKAHPENGRESQFGCLGNILVIEGMEQDAASNRLPEFHQWQTSQQFQYRHKWSSDMLVLWDNRSVLHRATGGYDRLLHRTTIGSQI